MLATIESKWVNVDDKVRISDTKQSGPSIVANNNNISSFPKQQGDSSNITTKSENNSTATAVCGKRRQLIGGACPACFLKKCECKLLDDKGKEEKYENPILLPPPPLVVPFSHSMEQIAERHEKKNDERKFNHNSKRNNRRQQRHIVEGQRQYEIFKEKMLDSDSVLDHTLIYFEVDQPSLTHFYTLDVQKGKFSIPTFLAIRVNEYLQFSMQDFYMKIMWKSISQEKPVKEYLQTVPLKIPDLFSSACAFYVYQKTKMLSSSIPLAQANQHVARKEMEVSQILRHPRSPTLLSVFLNFLDMTGFVTFLFSILRHFYWYFARPGLAPVRSWFYSLKERIFSKYPVFAYPKATYENNSVTNPEVSNISVVPNNICPNQIRTPFSIFFFIPWTWAAVIEEYLKVIPGMCYIIGILDAFLWMDFSKFTWHVQSMALPLQTRIHNHTALNVLLPRWTAWATTIACLTAVASMYSETTIIIISLTIVYLTWVSMRIWLFIHVISVFAAVRFQLLRNQSWIYKILSVTCLMAMSLMSGFFMTKLSMLVDGVCSIIFLLCSDRLILLTICMLPFYIGLSEWIVLILIHHYLNSYFVWFLPCCLLIRFVQSFWISGFRILNRDKNG